VRGRRVNQTGGDTLIGSSLNVCGGLRKEKLHVKGL